jgi:tape measure domain-containing protein
MNPEKVQVLIELLKQGDGGKAAAADLKDVETQMGKTSDAATQLRGTLQNLFVGISAGVVVNEIVQATVKSEQMNNTLKAVTGSSAAAAQEFDFVRQEAQRLGLDLQRNVSDYAKLSAAAKGTVLAGEGVRDIFKGIAEASTVLGLSASEQSGALQAIQQMISKGTVAAEELRGQLGERLPGAFNIAARAMGLTTQELGKMLEQGQIVATDFLPKFAAELQKAFSSDAVRSANSLNSEINRMKTAFFDLKASFGSDSKGLIRNALGLTTETLQFLKDHGSAIKEVAIALGAFVVALKAAQLAMGSMNAANAAFGAGWAKNAGDIAAASSLMTEKTLGMSGAIIASLGGIIEAARGVAAAYDLMKAKAEESNSAESLAAQQDARRKSLESQIALQLQLGKISAKDAADMRSRLADAFKVTNNPGAAAMGQSVVQVNSSGRQDALHKVGSMLAPDTIRPDFIGPPLPPEIAAPANTEAIQNLRKILEQMDAEKLRYFEREKVEIQYKFEARANEIAQLGQTLKLGDDQVAQMQDLNAQVRENELAEAKLKEAKRLIAEEEKRTRELEKQGIEEIRTLEAQLAEQAVNNSETKVQAAKREYNERIALIDKLFAEEKLSADKWNELSIAANAKRLESLRSGAEQGRMESLRLNAQRNGIDPKTVDINDEFKRRRENLEAYYELEKEKASGNAELVTRLEQQKTDQMQLLAKQQSLATDQLAQGLIQVGHAAESQFATGMASAFMAIADGSKSAKQAFSDFAVAFLKQVAQMILETIILWAVQTALRSLFGGGGQAPLMAGESSGSVANIAGDGGVFPAANGVVRAASGVDGVSEVDRPTLFPKFNVLAGEAGKEVLTVMAKPQLIEIDGIRAIMGNVGTNGSR